MSRLTDNVEKTRRPYAAPKLLTEGTATTAMRKRRDHLEMTNKMKGPSS